MKSSIPITFGDKIKSDFSFSRLSGNDSYAFEEHWHDCFEIIYVHKGSFRISAGNEGYTLLKGDIAFIPPGLVHSTEAVNGYRDVYVLGYVESLIYSSELSVINTKFVAQFRYGTGAKVPIICKGRETTESLKKLFNDINDIYNADAFARELLIRAKIIEIHATICSINPSAEISSFTGCRYIAETQSYIENHISEDISPYAIADALCISYSHLSRLIRNAYGCSMSVLILRMKLNYAERLMIQDMSENITDIALSSGFSSASYFAKCFRREKGISPNKFRSMLKGKQ